MKLIDVDELEKRIRDDNCGCAYDMKILIDSIPPVFLYEHDGCEGCKYGHVDDNSMPCVKCRQNYIDMYVRKPHWITRDNCANEGIYCSECHVKIFDSIYPPKKKLSNFCPNCGADMRDK